VNDSTVLCYHSSANGEYTLCGDAFDLNELDDVDALTPRFATEGQVVTCPNCRKQIDDIRTGLTKDYRVKKSG
jgi:hypothetical protein